MKTLIVLAFLLITPADHCVDVPLEGVCEVGCSIKQESHGWKLWLKLGYTNGGKWERLEKPPGREFWKTDSEAFARCSEWRACVTKKLAAHAEERRRNR